MIAVPGADALTAAWIVLYGDAAVPVPLLLPLGDTHFVAVGLAFS